MFDLKAATPTSIKLLDFGKLSLFGTWFIMKL